MSQQPPLVEAAIEQIARCKRIAQAEALKSYQDSVHCAREYHMKHKAKGALPRPKADSPTTQKSLDIISDAYIKQHAEENHIDFLAAIFAVSGVEIATAYEIAEHIVAEAV